MWMIQFWTKLFDQSKFLCSQPDAVRNDPNWSDKERKEVFLCIPNSKSRFKECIRTFFQLRVFANP